MNKKTILLPLTLLTLTLTACTNTTPPATPPAHTPTPTHTQPTTPPAPTYTQAHFGDTATWDNGHQVTIDPPHPYTIPNPLIAADHPGHILQFDITYTNNTNTPYDTTFINLTGTSDGTELLPVYDDAHMYPTATITPGDTLHYTAVFEIKNPDDITLKFDLSTFIEEPVYYTTK